MVNATPSAVLPPGKRPSTHCIGGWVGTKVSLDGCGKAVPLQAWSGTEGSRKLRFPDFITKAQSSGKVVSLTHRPLLLPGNAPGTHFC